MNVTASQNKVLHPFVSYEPHTHQSHHLARSRLWTIAALTCAVAFISLAIVCTVFTMIHYAVQLPLISILICTAALPLSFNIFKTLWDRASLHTKEVKFDQKIIDYLIYFRENGTESIVKNLGVLPGLPPNYLEPLIARCLYFQQSHIKNLNKAQDLFTAKQIELQIKKKTISIDPNDYTVAKTDFKDPKQVYIFQALQGKRAKVEEYKQKAAIANLKAAYLLKVIEDPYMEDTLFNAIDFVRASFAQRCLAEKHGDPSANTLIKANKLYTAETLYSNSSAKLSRKIFNAASPSITSAAFNFFSDLLFPL